MRKFILSLFFLSPVFAWAVYEKFDANTIKESKTYSVDEIKAMKEGFENNLIQMEAAHQEYLAQYNATRSDVQLKIAELDAILAQYK